MATLDDNNALLIFRVGPVYCCVPSLPIESVITPPNLTKPPGSSISRPGIFKFGPRMVSVMDLRYLFGVEKEHWKPGRNIIATINNRSFGFWVDDILDVLEMPAKGWSTLPALIPHDIFSRTLLLDDNIYLYTEVENLTKLKKPGLLKKYIEQLNKQQIRADAAHSSVNKNFSLNSSSNLNNKPGDKKTHTQKQEIPINQQQNAEPSSLTDTPQQHKQVDSSDNNQTTSGLSTNKQNTATKYSSGVQPDDTTSQTINTSAQSAPVKNDTSPIALNPVREQRKNRFNSDKPPHLSPGTTISTKPENKTRFNSPVKRAVLNQPMPVTQSLNKPDSKHEWEPDKKNTPSRTAPQNNETISPWPLIMAFLLILGSIGYFTYDWFYNNKQHLEPLANNSINHNKTPQATPLDVINEAVIDDAVIEKTVIDKVVVEEPAISEATPTQPIQINSTSKNENIPLPNSTTMPNLTKNSEAIEIPVKSTLPIDIEDNTQLQEQEQSPYHAEIARKGNEITIVLHEPEQTIIKTETETEISTVNEKQAFQAPSPGNQPIHAETSIGIDPLKNTEELKTESRLKGEKMVTPPKIEIVHIVVKGDTLWAIAKHYVNNPYRYPELARLSKIKNPDLIYPGNRVRIIKYETSHSN